MRGGRLLAVGLAILAAGSAQAGGRWGFGFYVGGPHYRPCCHHRPAVIVRPAPIYVAPTPVYVQPAPVVAVAASAPEETPPPPTTPTLPVPTARAVSSAADLEAMNDPSPQTRADAIIRIGRGKDTRAVRPLVRVLEDDKSPPVREAAARALGLIGSSEALPGLQRAASADQDHDVRKTASFAAEVIRASLRR